MAKKYEYDLSRAFQVVGAARLAQIDERRENKVPDPPAAKTPRVISRAVGHRERLPRVERSDELEQDPRLARFCPVCRVLMQGSGVMMRIMDENRRVTNEGYRHLPRNLMEQTASQGCAMCRVILRELKARLPKIPASAEIDANPAELIYDFGSIVGGEVERESARPEMSALLLFEYFDGGVNRVDLTLQAWNLEERRVIAAPSASETSTSKSVDWVLAWLYGLCGKEHSCLKDARARLEASGQAGFLPSRLVYVGKDNDQIRLVERANLTSEPQDKLYATLSHCWGEKTAHGEFSLILERLKAYGEKIPADKLPKTFLEAFQVTREVGLSYIWIDSLCIIQNSPEDWANESAQMWAVYTNSFLNISATASRDASEGLFRERSEVSALPAWIHVVDSHPVIPGGDYVVYSEKEWSRCVDQAPVNTRAWVMQERTLAPRVLHFAEGQVFWECDHLKACETYPVADTVPMYYAPEIGGVVSINNSKETKSVLEVWDNVVKQFSQLNLTYLLDKLVALSALAKQVSMNYPDTGRYLAGLWESDLAKQLLWRAIKPVQISRGTEYRAPSWSWACLDGRVNPSFEHSGYEPYGKKSRCRDMIKVLETSITLASSNQFGSAKDAHLGVQGCLFKSPIADKRPNQKARTRTPMEQREQWIKTIGHTIPGYTGETLQIRDLSGPEGPHGAYIGIDPEHGIMLTNDDEENPISGEPKISLGTHHIDLYFDTQEDLESASKDEVFVMPVLCISENFRPYNKEGPEIYEMGCLLLLPAMSGQNHTYRRVGVCKMDNNTAVEFLCALGNQGQDELSSPAAVSGVLSLEDVVPEQWPCKTLDFVPKELPLYHITLV